MQSKTLFSIIIIFSNLFELVYCTLQMWKTIMNNIIKQYYNVILFMISLSELGPIFRYVQYICSNR